MTGALRGSADERRSCPTLFGGATSVPPRVKACSFGSFRRHGPMRCARSGLKGNGIIRPRQPKTLYTRASSGAASCQCFAYAARASLQHTTGAGRT